MKKLKYIVIALMATCVFSCSLDETNYSNVDTDLAYSDMSNYQSLVTSCYENLYYLYGKLDGIGPMEMGTDLWKIGSRGGNHGDITNYNENLTTSTGVLRTVWNALYCMVGYSNTAIYYSHMFAADSVATLAAEARFIRGFALYHLVEQWGGVVLDTMSFAQAGMSSEMAHRSTEDQFYDQLIYDLKIAKRDLPTIQSERGRAAKKAAIAMLAKAYLQRTRLYESGSAEYKAYADSAFREATLLIDNASQYDCGLYESTADASGDTQVWDGNNNKDNKEYLFLEAVDHVNGYNPEWWNRGRTSQYYMMRTTQTANFGMNGSGLRYGRDNATVWQPTYYLLHECFEPKQQKSIKTFTGNELVNLAKNPDEFTADTRFENAFYYKYHALQTTIPTKATLARYRKDTLILNTVAKRMIRGSATSGSSYASKFPDGDPNCNYYASSSGSSNNYEDITNDNALACFAPNWELDSVKTSANKRLCVGISDYFNTDPDELGLEAPYSYFRNVFPSLKKHRSFKYAYTNQYDMMDMPIIRLTDIYLIAAEAAIAKGSPADGLPYLNAVRRHAALSTDAAEMEVGLESMTIDYILKERARELCGEQWRWYDLKRTGRLTQEYLGEPGKNPYITTFDNTKHTVRPIPEEFLNTIANPDEFGTNGY